jgi:hypothetical protein
MEYGPREKSKTDGTHYAVYAKKAGETIGTNESFYK